MIDPKAQLIVKHDRSGTFTDYSHKTNNFGRDSFTIDFGTSDYLYVGFRKPINAIYFNHISSYSDEGQLTLEVFNGSSWVSADNFTDDTLGFKRSGFVRFERSQSSQSSHAVDGSTCFWYRFKSSTERTELTVSGINLVFADDWDLTLEQPYITMAEFLDNRPSHIMIHQAVRNEIIQKFRNKDYYKLSNGIKEDLNIWDLLDIGEVRQAAVALAMSKIYFNMSDGTDDVWRSKSKDYYQSYQKFIELASLSLDLNDDGKSDTNEIKRVSVTRYMSR